MKKCTHCQSNFDDNLKFCPYCGQINETIVFVCERCENVRGTSHQFCGNCGSSFFRKEIRNAVTDIEGNIYNAVQIGAQIWMSQNMRVTVDRDGNELRLGKDYWYPNGDESLVEEYGLLYAWDAAMRIAPQGWHLPKYEEWLALKIYISTQKRYRYGNIEQDGKVLASKHGWKKIEITGTVGNNLSSNNVTGFSAVPAGGCSSKEECGFGEIAEFWSALEVDDDNHAATWRITHDGGCFQFFEWDDIVNTNYACKTNGFSVRCLKD